MSLELDSKLVKKGLWTDLDKGPVMGKTITTDTQVGNLVVAILAVVSTLGTAHLFHLLSFAYHQARANGRASDGLFRQQQALLRTLPTPSTVMAEAFKLWWAWRKNADRVFLRSFLLMVLALLFAVATIAASVFSSLIVDTGSITVLIDSPLCGGIGNTSVGTFVSQIGYMASSYADSCMKNGSLPRGCEVYMQPNIPLMVQDAPCPFLDSFWCNTTEAVRVDTGLVDMGETFGLNLKAKDRVQFRKKTTCTVLPIEDAYEVLNLSDFPELGSDTRGILPGEQVLMLFYGPTGNREIPAATYGMSLTMSNITGAPETADGASFFGDPELRGGFEWLPRDGLRVQNGTGDVFWKPVMPNAIFFDNAVDDPLYSAHRQIKSSEGVTRYLPDHPLKGVGCSQQYEICHARQGKEDYCTPLQYMPFYELRPGIDFPDANSMQKAMIRTFLRASWLFQTSGMRSLKAESRSIGSRGLYLSVPDGFWKQEVLGWVQESLASVKMTMAYYAMGPKVKDSQADRYWIKPETEGEKELCTAQKVRKAGDFVNINLFGLTFILTFSLLAMLIDISLLKFLIYMSRFRRQLGPRIERWIQDGVWQLQRRAYEGEGQRDWTNLESEIPLTDKGCLMKDLPILWVPEKSPRVMQRRTSVEAGSQETLRSDSADVNADADVNGRRAVRAGSRWYTFGRRRRRNWFI